MLPQRVSLLPNLFFSINFQSKTYSANFTYQEAKRQSMSLKVTQCQGWNSNLALTQRLLKPFWLHTQSWPHGYEISLPHRAPHPAAAAKSLQSCPTLCDPIDGSPPGSAIPGILQAITLEWVAISFSKAWKWKGKVKLLSHVWLLATPWTTAYQAPPSMAFSRQELLEWVAIAFSVLSSTIF